MVKYDGELSLVERNCFLISRSTVHFCPMSPYNTMGYGLSRSSLLPLGSIWGSVFDGLDALSPMSGGARLQLVGFPV